MDAAKLRRVEADFEGVHALGCFGSDLDRDAFNRHGRGHRGHVFLD